MLIGIAHIDALSDFGTRLEALEAKLQTGRQKPQLPYPNHTLVPHIRISIAAVDHPVASKLPPAAILSRLWDFTKYGSAYQELLRHIQSAHINARHDLLYLEVDCEKHHTDLLTHEEALVDLPGCIGLGNSAVIPENIWVMVRGPVFSDKIKKDVKDKQNVLGLVQQWKNAFGLRIKKAEFRCNILLLSFDVINQAIAACRMWLLFEDATRYAR